MSTVVQYVSAVEAARLSGVSTKSVLRWIKTGRLRADKRGRAYRVGLSEVLALSGHDSGQDSGPSVDSGQTADIVDSPTADTTQDMSTIPQLVGLVDRLTVENRQLAEALGMWMERARVLADQLALAAPIPSESPVASNLTGAHAHPTPEPSTWLSWTARGWPVLVLVAVLAAGILLLVPR